MLFSQHATKEREGGQEDHYLQTASIRKCINFIRCACSRGVFSCAKGEHIPKVEVELCLETGDKHTFMK